jgi:hypothetical protein
VSRALRHLPCTCAVGEKRMVIALSHAIWASIRCGALSASFLNFEIQGPTASESHRAAFLKCRCSGRTPEAHSWDPGGCVSNTTDRVFRGNQHRPQALRVTGEAFAPSSCSNIVAAVQVLQGSAPERSRPPHPSHLEMQQVPWGLGKGSLSGLGAIA